LHKLTIKFERGQANLALYTRDWKIIRNGNHPYPSLHRHFSLRMVDQDEIPEQL